MSNTKIIVENVWSKVENLPPHGAKLLYDELSYEVPGAFFAQRGNSRYWDWDGRKHLTKKVKDEPSSLKLYTGLVAKAKILLDKKFNIKTEVIDKRIKPEKSIELNWNSEKYQLRDYQTQTVEDAIKKSRGILELATGAGKCCNKNTLCITEEGMLPISYFDRKNLKEGSFHDINLTVTSDTKSKVDVAKKIYHDGIKESIEIETCKGFKIIGTSNHKIKILNNKGNVVWKKLSEIDIEKDYIAIYRKEGLFGKEEYIDLNTAYYLGLLYGDGGLNSKNTVILTTGDNHIIDFIRKYYNDNKIKYREEQNSKNSINIISGKKQRDYLLEKYGLEYSLSTNKKWPISILKSKKEIVANFIKGLYEADGWVEDHPSICIGLSNESFIDYLQVILLNFGILSVKRAKKTNKKDNFVLTIYRDNVNLFLEKIGLDENGRKYKKITKFLKKYDKKPNTNIDLIYNAKYKLIEIREKIKKEYKKSKIKKHTIGKYFENKTKIKYRTFNSYCFGKRNPSISNIKNILVFLEKEDRKYFNGDYFFDKIKKVKNVISDNYDFEIPESKCFIANGIVNHNTIIAARLIHQLQVKPFIFFVMTRELLYQAKNRLEDAMPGLNMGVIGDGVCDIQDINVMTIQTATMAYGKNLQKDFKKYEDDAEISSSIKKENLAHIEKKEKVKSIKNLIENCEGFYFDEAHHVPSKTAHDILSKAKKAYYRFGGSATPVRSDNADIMIEGLFGRKVCQINASYLIKRGFLMKPDIYYIKLNEKPRRVSNYNDDLKYNVIENEERNSQIEIVSKSIAETGLSVLILVTRLDHGKALQERIDGCEFIHGSSGSKKREDILDKLGSKKLKIVIATVIADEGLDLPDLNCVIMAGGGKSPVKCKQRVGRAIRKSKDKKYSLIFDFMDTGKYTKNHSKSRRKILEEEPEFNIQEINSFTDKKVYTSNLLF